MEFLPSDGRLLELLGEKDLTNRYASTVMVEVEESTVEVSCSGILLSPHLVLTAGHCVCAWRKAPLLDGTPGILIDGSACASQARVTAIRHVASEDPSRSALRIRDFVGKVRPHPELKLTLDAREAVVTSHADLAVILLEPPANLGLPDVPLAEAEARANEPLVMASYGNEQGLGGIYGTRYFKRGRVKNAQAAQGGVILYEPEGAYFNTGYRGGPCFRENEKGRWLLGVVGLGSDSEMSFTSIAFYRDWLREELRHAAASGPADSRSP
ncbi:trypsin-like serine protease [Hyalangium rubrum]|uniref:Trypsin-like serine protease n=1 Tax=Hyalangium rubrum TaxID=3103134 RepID=A0ABU5H1Z4_9BACT|nr:trypsin-like serine protease [Hyalangium sp. s54d21]MDY7226798.1 trypsin-like serine protease [Hyalangium sp. s54d21]